MHTILAHHPDEGLRELQTVEETKAALARPGCVVWVDISVRTPGADEILAQVFGFHPLAIEDVYKDEHRPKIEDYDRYLYIIVRALQGSGDWDLNEVGTTELDLFLGANFVVTHHQGDLQASLDALETFRKDPAIMGKGAVYVAHRILDRLVDRWLPLATAYEHETERLEQLVLGESGENVLGRILGRIGGIQHLRRMGIQQREILARLARAEFDEIPGEAKPFFRDVHEHYAAFMESLDFEREQLKAVFDAFHSLSSYRLNEVMKVLTVLSTIVLPLTFLTGLYGMNFDFMPELHWRFGYFELLAVMIVMAVVQVYYFRKRNWL